MDGPGPWNDEDMRRTKLLQYGIQRSGTNYLETMIRRRFRVRFLNEEKERDSPILKHVRLYAEKDLVPEPRYRNDIEVTDLASFEAVLPTVPDHFLVISKDPYSWYLSYRRFGERCGWPAPEHHYIEEYNHFYAEWLRMAEGSDRVHFVRYRDLLADPAGETARLQDQMGLRPRLLAGMRRDRVRRVKVSDAFTANSADYYLKEKYLEEYDSETLDQLNQALDLSVVKGLGYEQVLTSSRPS
jgi:hypothetical protein